MQTVEERASHQEISLAIMVQATALNPELPHGVRSHLGFHGMSHGKPWAQELEIIIFRDIVQDIEVTKEAVRALLATKGLPTDQILFSIIESDIAAMKKIYGDTWEFEDAFEGTPRKQKCS